MKRCRFYDVEATDFRIVHGEAIVMFGSDDEILHPGILCDLHPLFGVKFDGVELPRQGFILRHGDLRSIHYPFAETWNELPFPLPRRNRIESPVNEHSETRFTKPFHPPVMFGLRLCTHRLSYWLSR